MNLNISMFTQIIVLLLSIVIGTICIKYSFTLVKWFGHMTWLESKLWTASSYTIWKLIGMIIIALGALYGFGVI